jgi:hypothetical protein
MQLETFIKRLERLASDNQDFAFQIGEEVNSSTFQAIERKLSIAFPAKVQYFLSLLNGLRTTNPDFEILVIDDLKVEQDLVQFAIFDNKIPICFKVDENNNAGEWTIVEGETQFEITQTISSFWSNKIWHWLEKRHKIWADNWY